jgi:hypothetical protein
VPGVDASHSEPLVIENVRSATASGHDSCRPSSTVAVRLTTRRSGSLVWNVRHNVAYALDTYPDELIPYKRSLRSAQREVGDHFAGPFDSEQRAESVAIARLALDRSR